MSETASSSHDRSGASQDDRQIVVDMHKSWTAAFVARDLDRLCSLYADRIEFWGSTDELYVTPEGVRQYFIKLDPSYKRSVYDTPHVLRIADDMISSATFVRFFREVGGEEIELPFRMTHVLIKTQGHWKIVVHHASPQVLAQP